MCLKRIILLSVLFISQKLFAATGLPPAFSEERTSSRHVRISGDIEKLLVPSADGTCTFRASFKYYTSHDLEGAPDGAFDQRTLHYEKIYIEYELDPEKLRKVIAEGYMDIFLPFRTLLPNAQITAIDALTLGYFVEGEGETNPIDDVNLVWLTHSSFLGSSFIPWFTVKEVDGALTVTGYLVNETRPTDPFLESILPAEAIRTLIKIPDPEDVVDFVKVSTRERLRQKLQARIRGQRDGRKKKK